MRNVFFLLVVCLVFFSCSRTDNRADGLAASPSGATNMDSFVEKREERNLPNTYLYFYGKTKEEVVNRLGNSYKEEDILNENKTKESNWYDKEIHLKYDGIKVLLYQSGEKTDVGELEISREKEKYVGDISIGSSYKAVLKQLGAPNELNNKGYNSLIYNENNIEIIFSIVSDVVASIYVVRQM